MRKKLIITIAPVSIVLMLVGSGILIYEEDRYVIQVGYSRTDVEYATRETYYYEIPQK